jgi:hypothetical protein
LVAPGHKDDDKYIVAPCYCRNDIVREFILAGGKIADSLKTQSMPSQHSKVVAGTCPEKHSISMLANNMKKNPNYWSVE